MISGLFKNKVTTGIISSLGLRWSLLYGVTSSVKQGQSAEQFQPLLHFWFKNIFEQDGWK